MIRIDKIEMSLRLRQILSRNGCTNLENITKYSKESILKFRNMGSITYNELVQLCNTYNIQIYSSADLKDPEKEIYFSESVYEKLFKLGIKTNADINDKTLQKYMKSEYFIPGTYKKLLKLRQE